MQLISDSFAVFFSDKMQYCELISKSKTFDPLLFCSFFTVCSEVEGRIISEV